MRNQCFVIMKKAALLAAVAGFTLFCMCSETNSVRNDETKTSQGNLNLKVNIEKIGFLQKTAKNKNIELSKLIIRLLKNDSLLISDTVAISGNDEVSILKEYLNLVSSPNWKLEAYAIDQTGIVTHSGSKDFIVKDNATTNLDLHLQSKYSMVVVHVNNPPKEVNQAELIIDGTAVNMIPLSDSIKTTITFDYLKTLESHNIKVQLKRDNMVIYAGDTTISSVVPGQDKAISLILRKTDQGSSITVTLERSGTIVINATIETDTASFIPSGPWNADEHTLALYHFDNMVSDTFFAEETERWPAVNNGGKLVPGKFYSAISLQKNQYASMDTIIPNHTNSGTVEFYFKVSSTFNPDSAYFLVGNRGSRASFVFRDHQLFFIKGHHNIWRYVTSVVSFVPERWYHLAATWGEKGMRLYLDGKLIAYNLDQSDYQTSLEYYTVDYFTFSIGYKTWCCLNGIGFPAHNDDLYFDGAIDELRISDIERY